VSRTPDEAYRTIENVPVLRSFRACGGGSLPPVDIADYAGGLADLGIETVIVHKGLAGDLSRALWQDARTGSATYEGGDVVVYRTYSQTSPWVDRSRLLEGCIAVRSVSSARLTVPQGGVLEVPIEWWIGAKPSEPYVLELTLVDGRGELAVWHQYEPVAGNSFAGGERRVISYPFEIPPTVSPARYHLWATLRPKRFEARQLLSQQLHEVELVEVSVDSPVATGMRPVGAALGDRMVLQAYDVAVDAERRVARVSLEWQSLQAMDVDYKFFVHVYDATGNLVAQRDAMPRNWTYPTSEWQTGEHVFDEVRLSLEQLAPGTYVLGLGVYVPGVGTRLVVTGQPSEMAQEDGRLFLTEIVVP
jgi:hypothetical protein